MWRRGVYQVDHLGITFLWLPGRCITRVLSSNGEVYAIECVYLIYVCGLAKDYGRIRDKIMINVRFLTPIKRVYCDGRKNFGPYLRRYRLTSDSARIIHLGETSSWESTASIMIVSDFLITNGAIWRTRLSWLLIPYRGVRKGGTRRSCSPSNGCRIVYKTTRHLWHEDAVLRTDLKKSSTLVMLTSLANEAMHLWTWCCLQWCRAVLSRW